MILLKNVINLKTDNIVAFIKTQEQELLILIKKEGERVNAAQGKIIEFFNKHIIAHNEQQVADYLGKLGTAHLDKIKLKKRFSGILEHYITEREKMTMLSKQADKEELMRFTREQVNNL
jgi:hypothetical protein